MARKPSNRAPDAAFPSLITAAKEAVSNTLAAFAALDQPGAILAIDATCGNGNDTLFLARRLHDLACNSQRRYGVLGLDVQQDALDAAAELLKAGPNPQNVRLLHRGHEHLASLAADFATAERQAGRAEPLVAVIMYNLGFLPRSDKRFVTSAESTLASLNAAVKALSVGGIVTIHAYAGHAGGAVESEAVEKWCAALPYNEWLVARYAIANKARNPEALFVAQRRMRPLRAKVQVTPGAGELK